MGELFRRLIVPNGPLGVFRTVLGVFAILALIKYTTNYGFSSAIDLMIERYEIVLRVLMTPLKPVTDLVLGWMSAFVDWELELFPYWRHIFVLMGIKIFSAADSAIKLGFTVYGVFMWTLGGLISLFVSVTVGLIPLNSNDLITTLLIVAIPVAGLLLYEILNGAGSATFLRKLRAIRDDRPVPTWWEEFRPYFRYQLKLIALSIIVTVTVLNVLPIDGMQNPALPILALILIAWAFESLLYARKSAKNNHRVGETFGEAYWRRGTAKVGASMLNIFLSCLWLVGLDVSVNLMMS